MSKTLSFPKYMEQDIYKNHCVYFHVRKSNASDTSENAKNAFLSKDDYKNSMNNADTLLTICLPIPNILNDNQSHSWDLSISPIGTIGKSIEGIDIGKMAGAGISKLAGKIGGKIGSLASKLGENLPGYTAGDALGYFSNAAGMRKPLTDPGYFQNYSGSTPRSFGMTFDLIPENAEDAKNLLTLLMSFKKFTSPKSTIDGVSLLAPYFWDVDFGNAAIDETMNIKGMVITSVEINYIADGNAQFFSSGIPKHIQLSLSMSERRMMTMEDYEQTMVDE